MPDPKTVVERIIRRDLDFWEIKKRIRNLHEGFGTFLKIHALNEISSTIHYLLTLAYYGGVCPAFVLGPGLLLTYDEIESSWERTVCSRYLPLFTRADLLGRIIERMRRDRVCDRFDLRRSFLSEYIVQHDLAAESYEEIIEFVEQRIANWEDKINGHIQRLQSRYPHLQKTENLRDLVVVANRYSEEQWKELGRSLKIDLKVVGFHWISLHKCGNILQYYETVKEFLRSEKNWVKRVQEQGG